MTVELKEESIAFHFPSSNMLPKSAANYTSNSMPCSWEPDDKELAAAIIDFILRSSYDNLTVKPPIINTEYYITEKYSNLVLGVDRNNYIQLYELTQEYRPKWRLHRNYGGSVIYCDKGVLDVKNDSIDDGAAIIIYDYKKGDNDNQIWLLEAVENEYYYIVSKLSGKVLTAYHHDTYSGVSQCDKQGWDTQKWRFEAG